MHLAKLKKPPYTYLPYITYLSINPMESRRLKSFDFPRVMGILGSSTYWIFELDSAWSEKLKKTQWSQWATHGQMSLIKNTLDKNALG